jgi:transcriptional regulator with XRE-family HTH domain
VPPLDVDVLLRAVGRRLAELRAAAGLTQEGLAAQVDVSPRYLQRIESGVENLTLRSLVTLTNALDVPLQEAFVLPAKTKVRPGRPAKKLVEDGVAEPKDSAGSGRRSSSTTKKAPR